MLFINGYVYLVFRKTVIYRRKSVALKSKYFTFDANPNESLRELKARFFVKLYHA